MRSPTSRGAMTFAFAAALAGCQLLTGTYNADSSGGTLGPECTVVGLCCSKLVGSALTTCLGFVELANEQVCASYIQGFPNGVCPAGAQPDGGLLDLDSGKDAFQGRDVFVGNDTSVPFDAGHDTGASDPLEGTWVLSEIECEGEPLTLDGTLTISFSGANVEELQSLSDGCVITVNLTPATVTTSAITASNVTVTCGSNCTSTDGCTPQSSGTFDEPYTLSGSNSFSFNDSVATTTCASGSLTYIWSRN